MRFSFVAALGALVSVCSVSAFSTTQGKPRVISYDLFRTATTQHATSDVVVAPATQFLVSCFFFSPSSLL